MDKKLLFCTLFLCQACTVGPDYQAPDMPEDLQIAETLSLNGKHTDIPQNWYECFQNPELNRLIETALQNSPTIESSIAKLRQARSLAAVNRATYLPMLNADAEYEWNKSSRNIGLSTDTHDLKLGFDASWEIDLWGAGRRLNEQSARQIEQAFYNLSNIKTVLAAETAVTYFQLLTEKEKLRIAKENLVLQEEIFRTVSQKFQSGLTDSASYRQALYAVDNTKSLLPAMEYQIEAYQNALAVLLGVLPNKLPIDKHAVFNPVQKVYAYDLEQLYSLPSNIIRTRPDVRAAERALAAQNAAIGQAVAALYPNVSISGLFGFEADTGSKVFHSDSQTYGYVPTLSLPLWNWNKLQNEISYQKDIKDEVFQTYRQTVFKAVEELGNAVKAVQTEYKANKNKRAAAQNMRQAFNDLREQYNSGLIEFSALLTAEQNLLTAQTDLISSNGMIYQNIIAFYKAAGGGYASTSTTDKSSDNN
jgi:NodT family efflux transporter outer membrane factor (OMF) lipoprotein